MRADRITALGRELAVLGETAE
jgi:hypothetical protein